MRKWQHLVRKSGSVCSCFSYERATTFFTLLGTNRTLPQGSMPNGLGGRWRLMGSDTNSARCHHSILRRSFTRPTKIQMSTASWSIIPFSVRINTLRFSGWLCLGNGHTYTRSFVFNLCDWPLLFYYPGGHPSFFGGSQDDYLRDSVSFKKDVEGLSFTYRFNLYRNIRFMDEDGDQQLKCLLPCTALSVVKILEGLGVYDNT